MMTIKKMLTDVITLAELSADELYELKNATGLTMAEYCAVEAEIINRITYKKPKE